MQTVNQYSSRLTDLLPVQPAVSILMPFEPHLRSKTDLLKQLETAVSNVSVQIHEHYHNEMGRLVLQKLKKLIQQLNFNTFKKSVAICVSPVFEKIMYLTFPVETRVIVDTHFNIRDIVAARKEDNAFLLVNLSRYASNIYLGNEQSLSKVNFNKQDQTTLAPLPSFPPQKGFTDRNDLREQLLEKFLHQTDQSLKILLQSYPLPVFVTGSPKIIGQFQKISDHNKKVIRYIHGHFIGSPENEMKEMLEPVLREWDQIKLTHLRQRIELAADSGHLATGIRDVWKQAKAHNAGLLIVEEDFSPAAILHHLKGEGKSSGYSLVSNTLDDIIENVLECGGDVKMVKAGCLAGYDPIMLIKRYPATSLS